MKRYKTPDEFYTDEKPYLDILQKLRSILLAFSELEETIKWGAPAYLLNKKNLIGIGAFKSYAGLWFHQGALLKDSAKVLLNAQKGKTVAMRQWRFTNIDEVNDELVASYIQETIENCNAGKEIKPQKKPLIIPPELEEALDENPKLKMAFDNMSLSHKREYAEHILEAKRDETKQRRLEKCLSLIEKNIGLYDKYKNC